MATHNIEQKDVVNLKKRKYVGRALLMDSCSATALLYIRRFSISGTKDKE
jgi:hypothetical protein